MSSKKDKTQVTKSMLFSWYDDVNQIHTIIIPLKDYTITYYTDDMDLKIPCPEADIARFPCGKIKKWAFTQTDDPRIEWACDWSDMGTFRLVHKGLTATITRETAHIVVNCLRAEYGKDMWMPDKVRFDMYEGVDQ